MSQPMQGNALTTVEFYRSVNSKNHALYIGENVEWFVYLRPRRVRLTKCVCATVNTKYLIKASIKEYTKSLP